MRGIWLALLTIREAVLKGFLVVYFVIGNAIILFFAFGIRSTYEDGVYFITIFGQKFAPKLLEAANALDFVLLQLFQSSTSAIMLFGVFATAGLIPSMLEKGTIELYLSKPLTRTNLFLSRSLGACGGIAANMVYFALGIWAVFGIKIGIWHAGFLLASLMTIVIFVFYYAIVALVAVISRSTAVSIMLAFLYSLFSGALESRQHTLFLLWDNPMFHKTLDVMYYTTPQLNGMIRSASALISSSPLVSMHTSGMPPLEFDLLPFVYSFLSASLFYGIATWYFSRQDY
jgi:ABC-type transport system involved in multi-copper enzyme maturation permease subunit